MTDPRFTPQHVQPRPGAFPEVDDVVGAYILCMILEAGCTALGFNNVLPWFNDEQVNVEFDDLSGLDDVWINVGGHSQAVNGVLIVGRELFKRFAPKCGVPGIVNDD